MLNWHHLHQKLLDCKKYDDLSFLCNNLIHIIPHIPKTFTGEFTIKNERINDTAVYFAPRDICQEFLLHHPVEILPDGNCFFRSLSRLVYGTRDKHIEMRSRIVIDSFVNFSKYTDHSYLMLNATNTHNKCHDICEYYCAYSGVTNVGKRDTHTKGIQFVLREDIMRIRFEREHADIWQIHSAANVLGMKLLMVFPDRNIRSDVRADMNRIFLPQNLTKKCLGLMWTSVSKNVPVYNHIVPLISRFFSHNIIILI